VRIRLERPAALTRGDRFILRAYSPPITIAGGQILDPDPPRAGARTTAGVARFAALAIPERGTDHDLTAMTRMIVDAGGMGLARDSLVSRAGASPAAIPQIVRALEANGLVTSAGDRLVARGVVTDLSARLLAAIAEHHAAHPLADGLPREEARERLFARAHPAVFELVLTDLGSAGKIVARERLARAGHRLELSPEEARARDVVERAYRSGGLKPPDGAAIAAGGRVSPALVEKMTALLLRQKSLVRIESLVFHSEALSGLKSEIAALKNSAPDGRATVDVATFKDRYGVTRKFAIPLLEWLDRERVTRRVGDARIVL
jgi:selenocysteine-specific elongation factor